MSNSNPAQLITQDGVPVTVGLRVRDGNSDKGVVTFVWCEVTDAGNVTCGGLVLWDGTQSPEKPVWANIWADGPVPSVPVKAPPGHIIDDTGAVRKLLGTLPITGCGSVLGWGVFNMWRIVGNRREVVGPFHEEMGPSGWASQSGGPERCYSTEQAAREAAGGKRGK